MPKIERHGDITARIKACPVCIALEHLCPGHSDAYEAYYAGFHQAQLKAQVRNQGSPREF